MVMKICLCTYLGKNLWEFGHQKLGPFLFVIHFSFSKTGDISDGVTHEWTLEGPPLKYFYHLTC